MGFTAHLVTMTERIITVTDKNLNKIAVFSNQSSTHEVTSKNNMLVAPIIDIVSNGESTLTFQMLANSEKWQQIKNPENLYFCNDRVYTALNEQSIVYNGLAVTVTLVEIWYLLKYKYIQAHNIDTNVEALDEHTVKILPKTNPSLKLTVNGVQYDDSEVKDSRGVIMPRGSAGYALWALLKDTDWTLGICDVLPDGFDASKDYGTFNVETDMKDVLENIQFVQSLYGGILDWDSLHKILNFRDEEKSDSDFNTWKGFSARQGKNVTEFPNVTWDNNLITRLYPLGNGNLNIGKVNDGKNYVEDFSYTDRVYEGYIQNPNIYDTNDEGGQRTLKFWAEKEIKKLCHPRKTVTYSIVDKRGTSEGWTEPFNINDIIKAYYADTETGKEISEYLRIQHLTYNWFFPGSDTTIEVGDKVSNAIELFYQIYKDVDNSVKTNANGNISGSNIFLEIPEDYWDQLNGGLFGYSSLQTITNIHAEHETENTKAVADLSAYADATFATIASFTSFQSQTADNFSQSWTAINQTSSALEAQVALEAEHYSETKESIAQSNANITAVANQLSAQVALEASHYKELSKDIDSVSSSLASFEAYADDTYATTSQLSTYATKDYVTGKISASEASIKTWAGNNFASVALEATVDGIGSHFVLENNRLYMYATRYITGGSITLTSSMVSVGGISTSTTIYGSSISLQSNVYIPRGFSLILNGRTVKHMLMTDSYGDTADVLYLD